MWSIKWRDFMHCPVILLYEKYKRMAKSPESMSVKTGFYLIFTASNQNLFK